MRHDNFLNPFVKFFISLTMYSNKIQFYDISYLPIVKNSAILHQLNSILSMARDKVWNLILGWK